MSRSLSLRRCWNRGQRACAPRQWAVSSEGRCMSWSTIGVHVAAVPEHSGVGNGAESAKGCHLLVPQAVLKNAAFSMEDLAHEACRLSTG